MRKISLIILLAIVAIQVKAQKINLQNTIDALKENNFTDAKKYIDLASLDGSTSTNAKTWMLKGVVYQAIGTSPDLMQSFMVNVSGKTYNLDVKEAHKLDGATSGALETALSCYENVLKYDSKYDENELMPPVVNLMSQAFNNARDFYNTKKYKDAYTQFAAVQRIYNLGGGSIMKALEKYNKDLYTNTNANYMNAVKYKAYAAYYSEPRDNNLIKSSIEDCMKLPGAVDDQIYVFMATMQKEAGNNTAYVKTLEDGIAKFPDSKMLRNELLNYHLTESDPNNAIKKLEEEINKEPNRAELHFNAGILNQNFAEKFQGENNNAEANKFFDKAVSSYKKAMELAPDNNDYKFNFAALYFNKAKNMTDVMNKEKDDNKYEIMKKDRDKVLVDAMPKLESAKTALEADPNFKQEAVQNQYEKLLLALESTYQALGMDEKATSVRKILDSK